MSLQTLGTKLGDQPGVFVSFPLIFRPKTGSGGGFVFVHPQIPIWDSGLIFASCQWINISTQRLSLCDIVNEVVNPAGGGEGLSLLGQKLILDALFARGIPIWISIRFTSSDATFWWHTGPYTIKKQKLTIHANFVFSHQFWAKNDSKKVFSTCSSENS